jgi:hypothetical protein
MIELGDRVRVRAVPTSDASREYAGQLGKVMSIPPASTDWDYDVRLDDGTPIRVPRVAFTRIATDADGNPLE